MKNGWAVGGAVPVSCSVITASARSTRVGLQEGSSLPELCHFIPCQSSCKSLQTGLRSFSSPFGGGGLYFFSFGRGAVGTRLLRWGGLRLFIVFHRSDILFSIELSVEFVPVCLGRCIHTFQSQRITALRH